MSSRSQALILILFILISLTLTRVKALPFLAGTPGVKKTNPTAVISVASNSALSFDRASLVNTGLSIPAGPVRDWNVLDPKVTAKAVLIQSLDDHYSFFNYNTYQTWPIASITKLLTAVIVLEDIGANKKIPVSAEAIATEGEAGNLRSGEVYAAQDLLKIMLLTSSNDAAAAFEEYLGKDAFVRLLNQKADALGMVQTVLYDAIGLDDKNQSSASDLLRLARYILENHPEIFTWTRLTNFVTEPINDVRVNELKNIDAMAGRQDFLGGKTGTSGVAKENLLAILNHNNYRLAVIILGSDNRYADVDYFLNWIDKAYNF